MYQFYATFDASNLASYIPDVPVLLPASSWARKGLKKPALPSHVTYRAADSGGFVASRIWGEYRYSLAQYVDWLGTWTPQWAATMDYCCEPELAVVTRERQEKTTRNVLRAWEEYRTVPWAWVPTIQGLEPEDYRMHALELKPMIEAMRAYYEGNTAFRVGIGTLCRRADSGMIRAIVREVQNVLPGIPLHLWGVKLESLWTLDMSHIVSTDSAAWHGQWGGNRQRTNELAREAGMNKQRYLVHVALPAYIERVEEAVHTSYLINASPDESLFKRELKKRGYTLKVRKRNGRKYAYAVKREGEKLKEIYLSILHEVSSEIIINKLGNVPAGRIPNYTQAELF